MVCDDLRAAISGAFSTWGANHRDLSFHDVSHACARAEDCEVAEVLISAESMSGEYADLAAYVRVDLSEVNRRPTLTNRLTSSSGIGVRAARMSVASNLCWYLDATFCSWVHSAIDRYNLTGLVRGMLILIFVGALLLIIGLIAQAHLRTRGIGLLPWLMGLVLPGGDERRKPPAPPLVEPSGSTLSSADGASAGEEAATWRGLGAWRAGVGHGR